MRGEMARGIVIALRRTVIGIGVLVFVTLVVRVVVGEMAMDLVASLMLGWYSFLARTMTRVTISTNGLVTAGICLVLFVVGLHGFLRWLTREIRGSQACWKMRWSLSIVALVVLMFAAGIATVGVAHQTGWLLSAKRPLVVDRMSTSGYWSDRSPTNLKQIGVALHQYSIGYDELPFNAAAGPRHSWQSRILLYSWEAEEHRINFDLSWDDPRNAAYFKGIVRYYLNPEIAPIRDHRGYALSHYAGNMNIFGSNVPRRFEDIKNGLSTTMMAAEIASGFKPWGDPTNLRDPMRPFDGTPDTFGGPSGEGTNVLMLDGSVKFVSRKADPRVLRAMSGR